LAMVALTLNTSNKRPDVVSRSRAVVPDSWSMALGVRVTKICISTLRKYQSVYTGFLADFISEAQIQLRFKRQRSSARTC